MSGDSMLELPCLGRPFELGMLYDCRNDYLIPGMTLWDSKVLEEAKNTRPMLSSNFEVITEDSIADKMFHLGVEASLKLSLLGGLVNVSGSAKYLDDRKSSKNQARVSLKYWSTTSFEQLTMEQLATRKIQHPDVFDKDIATHVVTGVLYGAEAFFVFDRMLTRNEIYHEIHGRMSVLIKALPGICEIEGSAGIKDDIDKFQCTFYGDFRIEESPSTFEEAVKVYKDLPKLTVRENGPNTIPKKVWLCPLSKIDSKAARIVREISASLVSQTQTTMEDLHELEMRTNDLMKVEMYFGIPEQLSKFKEMIGEYKSGLTKTLMSLLPRIRGGSTKEEELAEIFKANHASPFSTQRLSTWLHEKDREVKVLSNYLDTMRGIEFAFSPGALDLVVNDIHYDSVLCFVFQIAGQHDSFLKTMMSYLRKEEVSEDTAHEPWYKNRKLMGNMRLQAKQFKIFLEANAGLKSLVTDTSSEVDRISEKGAIIELYKDGIPVVFEPPGLPGKPMATSVTHQSIRLKWAKPEYGSQQVQFYSICYRSLEDPPEQWMAQKTDGAQEMITVSSLAPKAVYSFKVRSECDIGASLYSAISDPIETDPIPEDDSLAKQMKARSKLIADGPPAVYKLPVKEIMNDKMKMISKCCIGRSHPTRVLKEKVLMVVGATGAGKSTLINGMVNYILGVQWKHGFRFQMIADQAGKSQAHSQTKWITAYTFHEMEGSAIPYTLTIIDTPGFGDTDGLERDKHIASQIEEFFSMKNGIDHLDGVGFVTQASLARLTHTQRYIFDSILSIFGKDIRGNISMMVTFADGAKPPVMDAVKAADIPCSKYFTFNNSALFSDNGNRFSRMFWTMGFESFRDFFSDFGMVRPVSLKMTKEVLHERQRLETTIESLQQKVNIGLSKIDELRQEEMILSTRQNEIVASKDFTYTVKVSKEEKIDLKRGTHVTNCLECHFTCHYPCGIPDDGKKWGCAAMTGDRSNATCEQCPCRGPWHKHYNRPYRFEWREVEEERTSEDLKSRYDEAMTGKTQVEAMISNMEEHLEFLYNKVLEMIGQAKESLTRLDKIALKPNPLTEVQYIDLLIESEKQEAKTGFHQRIKYYQEVRKQALLLSRVKDVKAPEPKSKQRRQKHWWSTFKFW